MAKFIDKYGEIQRGILISDTDEEVLIELEEALRTVPTYQYGRAAAQLLSRFEIKLREESRPLLIEDDVEEMQPIPPPDATLTA